MKRILKLLVYGASIHPGNAIYLTLIILAGIAFYNDESIGQVKGFLCGIAAMSILLAPLYIYTSYAVGKANAQQDTQTNEKASAVKDH